MVRGADGLDVVQYLRTWWRAPAAQQAAMARRMQEFLAALDAAGVELRRGCGCRLRWSHIGVSGSVPPRCPRWVRKRFRA